MSDRADFNKMGEEILNFLDAYGMLKAEHVEKFFPGSKKVVSYLVKTQRIHKSLDEIYISVDQDSHPDKCLIAALGVLADVFEKVKSHAKAMAPVQISFLAHNGDFYEIIYVGYGMESMVTAFYETQIAAEKRGKERTDNAKRMVIVEHTEQMERLPIQGIVRFALIQPDGSLIYYKAGS